MNMKKYNTKKDVKGFTLIELMITVAIVGVLAAVAVPNYQSFVKKAQLAEGLSLLSGAKAKYAEFIGSTGRLADDDEGDAILDGTGDKGSYVDSITIEDGKLVALMGGKSSEKIKGTKISLSPIITSTGGVRWECIYYGERDVAPSVCQTVSP